MLLPMFVGLSLVHFQIKLNIQFGDKIFPSLMGFALPEC